MFENDKRSIRVDQKLYYLNNPRYLSFLYCAEDNSIELDSNNLLFLSDAGMKKIEKSYKLFNRTFQDDLFERHIKENYEKDEEVKKYFILRLLEKIYIKYVFDIHNSNKISKENKFKVIEKILNYSKMSRKTLSVTNENFLDLEERIEFVLTIIKIIEGMSFTKNILRISNIDHLYGTLETLPERYFKNKNHMMIRGEDLEFTSEISVLQDVYSNLFSLKFMNFSDGELIYLNVFSAIAIAISDSKEKDCILLLDEPDINLHPEWSRRLMFDMFRLIKQYKQSGNVQIILTSHSPFIVTDFPKENIYSFRKDKNKYEITTPDFGFAANIYDVIADAFFMEAPIGEFAINQIKIAKDNPKNLRSIQIIDSIDDSILKKILKKG